MLCIFSPWLILSYQGELNTSWEKMYTVGSSTPWRFLKTAGICGKRWHKSCVWNTYMRWDVQATLTHDHTAWYSQVVPRGRIGIPELHGQQTRIPETFQTRSVEGKFHSHWSGEWEPIMLKRFGKLLLCTHRTDEGVCFPLSQYDAETLFIKLQALLIFTDDGLFCKAMDSWTASPCFTRLPCLWC